MKKLLFIGDLIFGDGPTNFGYGFDSINKKSGYKHVFNGVKAYLKKYKYVIGNFEGLIRMRLLDQDIESWSLCCDERICKQLVHANINVLSMANNHTMDYGAEVFDYTKNILQDHGIKIIGLRERPYEILNLSDKQVAVLGVTYLNNNQKEEPKCFYKPTDQQWDKILTELEPVKYKIAYVHWGNEFVTKPTEKQIMTARELINYGFNIIIGHHPHILQERAMIGSNIVCFSLGNFVSSYQQERLRKTIAVSLDLNELTRIGEIHCKIDSKGRPWVIYEQEKKLENYNNEISSSLRINFERFRMRIEYGISLLMNFPRLKGKKKIIKWCFTRLLYIIKFGIKEIKNPDIIYDKYKK